MKKKQKKSLATVKTSVPKSTMKSTQSRRVQGGNNPWVEEYPE